MAGLEVSLEEELTCGICLGLFQDPRILPACGHSYCAHCLKELWRQRSNPGRSGSLACPECRTTSHISSLGSIDNLDKDRRAIRLLQILESHRSASGDGVGTGAALTQQRDIPARPYPIVHNEQPSHLGRTPEPSAPPLSPRPASPPQHVFQDTYMVLDWSDSIAKFRICNRASMQDAFGGWFERQWLIPREDFVGHARASSLTRLAPQLENVRLVLAPFWIASVESSLEYEARFSFKNSNGAVPNSESMDSASTTSAANRNAANRAIDEPLRELLAALDDQPGQGTASTSADTIYVVRSPEPFQHQSRVCVRAYDQASDLWSSVEKMDVGKLSILENAVSLSSLATGFASSGSLYHPCFQMLGLREETSVHASTISVDSSRRLPADVQATVRKKAKVIATSELTKFLHAGHMSLNITSSFLSNLPFPRISTPQLSELDVKVLSDYHSIHNLEKTLVPFWIGEYYDRTRSRAYRVIANAATGDIFAERSWQWSTILNAGLLVAVVGSGLYLLTRLFSHPAETQEL